MTEDLIRKEAITAYNAAFQAVEKGDQQLKAIELSAASLYLWRQVGNDQNIAIGYWLYSRALAAAGSGDLAVDAANESMKALARIESPHDWLVASVHEGLARALVVAKDDRADAEITKTAALISKIANSEDRALIEEKFSSIKEKSL